MWEFLRRKRAKATRPATVRRCAPELEALESRIALAPAAMPPPPNMPPPPPGQAPPPPPQNMQERQSSIEASQALRPPPPPPPPASAGPAAGPGQGNNSGRPMGGMNGSGDQGPPPTRPPVNDRDPGQLLGSFAHPARPAPPASRPSPIMYAMFSDLDDALSLVEISGEFSFLESDAQSTDREFAALITNTRPRPDVVPQQGSAVASVATLMPSDRPDSSEPAVANELAPLLIDPLNAPAKKPAERREQAPGPGAEPPPSKGAANAVPDVDELIDPS
jgi:hypothetical protein